MTESQLYKILCRQLKPLGWFMRRVENGAVGPAFPDVFMKYPESDPLLVELKSTGKLFTASGQSITLKWQSGQIAWAKEYQKAKGQWRVIIIDKAGNIRIGFEPKLKYEMTDLAIFNPQQLMSKR